MKNLTTKMDDLFMKITFAEEPGDNHMKDLSVCFRNRLDDIFTAITFAEAGEFDTVKNVMDGGSGDSKLIVEYTLHGVCAGKA